MSDTPMDVGMAERVRIKIISLKLFFLISGIEGIFVILNLSSLQSEAKKAIILGFSLERLTLLVSCIVITIIFLGIFARSIADGRWLELFEDRFDGVFDNRYVFFIVVILSLLFAIGCVQFAIYSQETGEPVIKAVLSGLFPILIWVSLISFQLIIILAVRYVNIKVIEIHQRQIILGSLLIFLFLLLSWLIVEWSGYVIGEESEENGIFRVPGIPLLGLQFFAAWIFSCVGFFLLRRLGQNNGYLSAIIRIRSHLLGGLLIWILAVIFWVSAPLTPSWFADHPRPPNNTFSPNSDAFVYDTTGHSLIVGEGLYQQDKGYAVRRPMLSAIVAGFHWIAGLGYEDVIGFQIVFLSLFPVFVYLITYELHGQLSGFLASFLIILRERNAILLADTVTVSHAKLIMSDLPATLGVVVILWLSLNWLKYDPANKRCSLLIGGVIGFFSLIRSEITAFILIIALISMWVLRQRLFVWLQNVTIIVLGSALVVAPWMWRNSITNGYIFLDKNFRYSPVIENFKQIFEESSNSNNLIGVDRKSFGIPKNGYSVDVLFEPVSTIEDPESGIGQGILSKIIGHVINGHLQLLITFPQMPSLLYGVTDTVIFHSWGNFGITCCSVEHYVRALPYWWSGWDGTLVSSAFPFVIVSLAFLSLGASVTIKRQGILSLLLLFSVSFYIMIFAINKMSGGRWLLEVDWILITLFSIGVSEITTIIINWLGGNSVEQGSINILKTRRKFPGSFGNRLLLYIFVAIVFMGASLPLSEILIPSRYSKTVAGKIISEVVNSDSQDLTQEEKLNFYATVVDDEFKFWIGRALYPRFFANGDGVDGKFDRYKLPFSRVEFYMVGMQNGLMILPLSESPIEFPHAVDVLVVGCDQGDYIDVVSVVVDAYIGRDPIDILFREADQIGKPNCNQSSD